MHLSEEAEEDACRYSRTDHSGNVRCHRVHQKVVVLVEFTTHILRYSCCIRYCGHSGISDERIDLVLFLAEQVHDLYKADSADGCNNEREESETEDLD